MTWCQSVYTDELGTMPCCHAAHYHGDKIGCTGSRYASLMPWLHTVPVALTAYSGLAHERDMCQLPRGMPAYVCRLFVNGTMQQVCPL